MFELASLQISSTTFDKFNSATFALEILVVYSSIEFRVNGEFLGSKLMSLFSDLILWSCLLITESLDSIYYFDQYGLVGNSSTKINAIEYIQQRDGKSMLAKTKLEFCFFANEITIKTSELTISIM